MQIGPDGSAYLAGVFKGSVRLTGINGSNVPSLSLTSHNRGKATDGFLLKFDTLGNVDTGWGVKQFGGDKGNLYEENSTTVAIGTNSITGAVDGVFITGIFNGTVDFNPGPTTGNLISSGGSNDLFVVKLDGSGNHVWSKRAGSTGVDYSYDIAVAADGSPYLVGAFRRVQSVRFELPGVQRLQRWICREAQQRYWQPRMGNNNGRHWV